MIVLSSDEEDDNEALVEEAVILGDQFYIQPGQEEDNELLAKRYKVQA